MADTTFDTTVLQPGQRLARGVSRHMRALGFASLEEFVPTRGLRVDVLALGPKGELWVIECKSSRARISPQTTNGKGIWNGVIGSFGQWTLIFRRIFCPKALG